MAQLPAYDLIVIRQHIGQPFPSNDIKDWQQLSDNKMANFARVTKFAIFIFIRPLVN